MNEALEEIRIRGKTIRVPAALIRGRAVVATGKWIRIAAVKDEDEFEGEPVDDPAFFVSELRRGRFKADIFSFAQKLTDAAPRHDYRMEWDNAAVIPLKDFSDWWDKRLSQDTRRNVRRAAKMGVTVQIAQFDDALVKGIKAIYDETPVRQGAPFAHFRKELEVVAREAGTYLDRSTYLGAYHENVLIGFIKLTYTDNYARIIHILSMEKHADKRPTNALVSRAVEICVNRGLKYLTYCRYIDGGNEKSPLTEFKRRNGFEQLSYPRYFVPLTARGSIALTLGLHRGLRNALPKRMVPCLLRIRGWFLAILHRKSVRSHREPASQPGSTA